MSSDYITKIKANISIFATKKTGNILDGTYTSIFMGRSLNFEDLREYVPGDSIRDIDWKASSRSRNLLVKRYVAEKKHNVLFVFDTGAKMNADTTAGNNKKETALYTMGTAAYLAYKNGDTVGAIYNNDGMVKYYPFKTGLLNIENILAHADKELCEGKSNNLDKSLNYIVNNFRRKMIIFVITDMRGINSTSEAVLKRLMCRHDVLFINIGDTQVTGKGSSFNVEGNNYIPSFIRNNKKLMKLEADHMNEIKESNTKKLIKHGIMDTEINDKSEIVEKLIDLLERHKNANLR